MSRRTPRAISTIVGVVLLLSTLLAGVVSAEAPQDQPLDAQRYQTNAQRGLIFTKLAPGSEELCKGLLHVVDTDLCTHGPDLPPDGFDVTASVAASVSAQGQFNAAATVPCEGDGTSGKRVEVLYVRASDKADRYASYLASFQQWAADADNIYNASAAETGGTRHIRYVHDSNCVPLVRNVVVTTTADDTFSATVTAISNQGYNRADRKYMLFVDSNVYCGIGGIRGDDSPGTSNSNNGGPSYGRTDSGCWSGSVAAHELMHNLGGVQLSAPHTTGGYHCRDEWDLLCYSDSPNYPTMITVCSASSHDQRLDCNHDDYFHTNPAAGSYLATHWNAANSQFLFGGSGTNPPPCPDAALEPDNSAAQARTAAVPSDIAHAFCTAADEDWVVFQATAGTNYRIDTAQLGGGVDTVLTVYAADGSTVLSQNDDTGSGLESSIELQAAAAGAHYVRVTNLDPDDDVANTYRLRISATDSAPPSVSWTGPVTTGGTHVVWQGGPNVTLAVTAQDASGIASVEFRRWDAGAEEFVAFAEDGSAPYTSSLPLSSLSVGQNEIVAYVEDVSGNSAQASIFITLSVNAAPTARAGTDMTVDDTDQNGTQAVSLDGSASSDSDGNIVAWNWKRGTQTVGSSAAVSTNLPVGQHTLTLTVTDNLGATGTDTVQVTVRSPIKPLNVTAMTFSAATSGSSYRLSGSVTVKSNGANVQSATVTVRYTYPNGSTATQTATTNSSGVASFTRTVSSTGTYTLAVTNVTRSTYTYAPETNVVSSKTATAGSSGGGGSSMSVSAMSLSRTTISGGYRLNASVTVRSASAAVSAARVTIEITYPNGSKATLSANTSSSGVANFTRNVTAKGAYTVRVTTVSKSGWTYNAAGNAVSSRSITLT